MSQIILDVGSANTHKNDWPYLKKMLDELKKVDTGKHEIVIKHQLFTKAGENIPLKHDIFEKAYSYAATELNYQTASSVFDKESLDYLLQFKVPFIKIANNRKLDWLIGEIPRKIPVYVSYGYKCRALCHEYSGEGLVGLSCVSKYPATLEDYEKIFKDTSLGHINKRMLLDHVSDHTTNFDLWYRYQPKIIEWHYVLEHDPSNLDGGPFARTPAMLAEIL